MGAETAGTAGSSPARMVAGAARRSVVLVVIAVTVALILSGCTGSAGASPDDGSLAGTTVPAETSHRLDVALADAMTLAGASGAIAGVWAPWSGRWVVAPGTTSRGGTDPMSTGMRFRIGAITRSMTCTVLLELVDEGKVAVDDLASKYLTRTPGIDGITLRQLCQGTSGLADYRPELAAQFVNNPTRVWPPMELVSSSLASGPVGTPGETWHDSSGGYVLLGLALESATGQSWPSLYQKYIVSPLQLDATTYPKPESVSIKDAHPHGYAVARNPAGGAMCETVLDDTQLSNSMAGVSGGVVSSLGDLKAWSQALATGRLLSRASTKAQWTTVPMGKDASSWQEYGLGAAQIGPFRGEAGAIPGFISAALSDPTSGLTVVVMLNNSSAGAAFAQHLAQRLASIASKLPATSGKAASSLELPWSEDQMVHAMASDVVCKPAAAPPGA